MAKNKNPQPEASRGYLTTLAVAVREGEDGRQDELWCEAERCVKRQAVFMAVPATEIPDLTQEVLIDAFKWLDKFDPQRAGFVAFLFVILRTWVVRSRIRLRRAREHLSANGSVDRRDPSPSPFRVLEVKQAYSSLVRLISRLSPKQRAVFVLRDVEGCTTKETASTLRISEGSVKVHLHKARARLREWHNLETAPSTSGQDEAHGGEP